MRAEEFDQRWRELAEEAITGMKEWRQAHPKATLWEIEAALDERLDRLRARMLEDAAQATAATTWSERPSNERPKCPTCGTSLVSRGKARRRLATQGGEGLTLERSYGVCPVCQAGLFPPR